MPVGNALGALRLPAITRLAPALHGGASNDHYAIHVDTDFAKAQGLDDVIGHGVIGHGMLSMACFGCLLGDRADPRAIRSLQAPLRRGHFLTGAHSRPGEKYQPMSTATTKTGLSEPAGGSGRGAGSCARRVGQG